MAPNKENVQRLVDAAYKGMEGAIEGTSAEDVVNAAIAIAAGAIRYACSNACAENNDALLFNRRAIRAALQKLLLETIDDLQVM